MNTENVTVGYLVDLRYWEQPDQNHTKLFVDADLLTARQAAFRYAQDLTAQKSTNEVLDITISLTEVKNDEPWPPHIAQIFNRRFHRNEIKPDPNAVKIAIRVDPETTDKTTAFPNVTLDVTRRDEAFESADAVKKCLAELVCEYEYYQSYGYPPGFGFILMTTAGPGEKNIVKDAIAIDTDEDLFRIQERLRKPFRMQAFWMLYDALTYAASLVGDYNHSYADQDEYLAFGIEPVPSS